MSTLELGEPKVTSNNQQAAFVPHPLFLSLDSLKNTPGEQCSMFIPATMGSSDGLING